MTRVSSAGMTPGKRRRKRRDEESSRSLLFSFRLRPGTSDREAQRLAGFVGAAIDDAAAVYRARHGRGLFDGEGGPVLAADVEVTTLH